MLYLSRQDIESIGVEVVQRYRNKVSYADKHIVSPLALAEEVFRLDVGYDDLLPLGGVLGITAFEETEIKIWDQDLNLSRVLALDENTIIVEQNLVQDIYMGRLNFTIAHETAHQILKRRFPTAYCCGDNYSGAHFLRERSKTPPEWEEWQTDVLASSLLMQQDAIDYFLFINNVKGQLKVYPNKRLVGKSRDVIYAMAKFFGVSKAAMLLRLEKLGYLQMRSMDEFFEAYDLDCMRRKMLHGTGKYKRRRY